MSSDFQTPLYLHLINQYLGWRNCIELTFLFNQMLVIAATEPCSLQHSDPPRTTGSQRPLTSGLRTIPLRPMPKSYTGSPSPVIIPPEQACKTPQSHGKDAASNPSSKTTTVASQSAVAEEKQSELMEKTEANKDPAMSSTSATPKSLVSQPVSKPTRPVSASSAVPSLTSGSVQPDKQPDIRQSKQAWKHRPIGMKSVVDFGKIYKFISNIIFSKHTEPLTSMGMYSCYNNLCLHIIFLLFVN